MSEFDDNWWRWRAAAREPAVDASLRSLYARLDAAVAERGPTCWLSGRCCNFEAFGHRLYVTGLEIAWLLETLRHATERRDDQTNATALPLATDVEPRGGCPFQIDKLCTVHAIRPLGCRVFFCEEGTEHWQHEVYERFLAELQATHASLELPYRYMEWRAGLREALEAAREPQ